MYVALTPVHFDDEMSPAIRKPALAYAGIKGADQPEQSRSLVSILAFRLLDCVMSLVRKYNPSAF